MHKVYYVPLFFLVVHYNAFICYKQLVTPATGKLYCTFLNCAAAVYNRGRPHCSGGTSTWWMNTFIRMNTDEEDSQAALLPSSCHLDCPFQKPLSQFQVSCHAVLYRLSPTEVTTPVIAIIKDKAMLCFARGQVQKAHTAVPLRTHTATRCSSAGSSLGVCRGVAPHGATIATSSSFIMAAECTC